MKARKTAMKKGMKAPKPRKLGQQKGTPAKGRMQMGQKMSNLFKDKDKDKM